MCTGGLCVCVHAEVCVRVCKQSCAHVEHVGVRRRDPPGCPHPAPPGTLTWSWGCHRDGIRCGGHPRDPSPPVGTGTGTGSALSPGHGGCRGVAAAPPPPDAAAPGGNAGVIAPLAAALARPRPLAPNFLA